jgi:hypothetical protein
MEKLSKHIRVKLPPARLYLNDLREIESILKEHCEVLSLAAEGYGFASIDELKDLKVKSINELNISSSKPFISLDFSFADSYIYSRRDDANIHGMIVKIAEFLKGRRKWSGFLKSYKLYFVMVVFVFGLQWLIASSIPSTVWVKDGAALLSSLILMLGWIYITDKRIAYNVINLYERVGEKEGFFKRNQDQIVIRLLFTILGVILGAMAVKLLAK